jgi:hypothetical protein
MSGLTKLNLSMVSPPLQNGGVIASGQSLTVDPKTIDLSEFSGYYDRTQGILTLNIPTIGKINIGNFPTSADIGTGRTGPSGRDGVAGVDGLIGETGQKGLQGCRGPEGPQGRQGERGPRGLTGPQGEQGIQGIQGNDGRDGRVLIFVQSEDPGSVGAGALWVRP